MRKIFLSFVPHQPVQFSMHIIDLSIFILYMIGMLGVGFYFLRKNTGTDDYYVGGRGMGSGHIGLSVVATDVGGGFSIGLGGLGFVMGLSGSWMLFTGLIGAWLAAVFLIPRIKNDSAFAKFLTFPQLFEHFFNRKVAIVAAVISAIGYAGFTSSQILAGAKLANGTFASISQGQALVVMGAIAVIYTAVGGIKAVIYTDTIQWILLLAGLIFIGLPMGYKAVGGWEAIQATLKPEMLRLDNVAGTDLINWAVTIIPIWFVGMTLYQRIYAARDTASAKRAWYLAGLFEWPIMAFMGVALGLLARVAADQGMFAYLGPENISATDPETGLALLLRTILPTGLMGLMMAAYFSAILSTADSCLMASSGNITTDLISRILKMDPGHPKMLRISQLVTLILGAVAVSIAYIATNVLDLMLLSYGFLVSGLFVPVVAALANQPLSPTAAMMAMLGGGTTTAVLGLLSAEAEGFPFGLDPEIFQITLPFGLDPNVFGIAVALILYVVGNVLFPKKQELTYSTSTS